MDATSAGLDAGLEGDTVPGNVGEVSVGLDGEFDLETCLGELIGEPHNKDPDPIEEAESQVGASVRGLIDDPIDLVTQPALGPEGAVDEAHDAAEAERERVRTWFAALPRATVRPVVSVATSPPGHAAHLGDNDPVAVQVPADGMCLYYCAVACRDLGHWVSTHDAATGLARDPAGRQRDVVSAAEVKDAVMMAAAECGDKKEADRLKQEGPAGYPGQETLLYLSKVLGGQVVLQSAEVQEVVGHGPLVAHLGFCLSVDGAGHSSGHFVVHQSWAPLPRAAGRPRVDGGLGDDGGRAAKSARVAGTSPVGAAGVGGGQEGVSAAPNPGGAGCQDVGEQRGVFGGAQAPSGAVPAAASATGPPAAPGVRPCAPPADGPRGRAATNVPTSVGSLLSDMAASAGGFEARPDRKDVHHDPDDIVQMTRVLYQKASSWFSDTRVQEVAVVLLLTHQLRLVDMSMKEYVHIIYAIEGDRHLRSHNGTLYLYQDGAWRPFCGIFPVSVLTRVRRVLSRLEGLLHMLPANTARTDDGVLGALQASVSQEASVEHWVTATELAVLKHPRHEEGEATGWGPWLATTISKVRATTTNLLCGRKCVPYIVEWCETPIVKASGFSCKDACFLFREDGTGLFQEPKSPSANVYMYLPQNVHDAVAHAHVERLQRFLTTTFHNNAAALKCHFAAFSLVLRGYNIDRAFWTLGAGGVGQSLLSHLVATVFGDHHAFLDMNMYYTDDELRPTDPIFRHSVAGGRSVGVLQTARVTRHLVTSDAIPQEILHLRCQDAAHAQQFGDDRPSVHLQRSV